MPFLPDGSYAPDLPSGPISSGYTSPLTVGTLSSSPLGSSPLLQSSSAPGLTQAQIEQAAQQQIRQKISGGNSGGGFLGLGLGNLVKIPSNFVSGALRTAGNIADLMGGSTVGTVATDLYNAATGGGLSQIKDIPGDVVHNYGQSLQETGREGKAFGGQLLRQGEGIASTLSGGTAHPGGAQPFWSRPGGILPGLIGDIGGIAAAAAPIAGGLAGAGAEAGTVTESAEAGAAAEEGASATQVANPSAMDTAVRGGLSGLAARAFAQSGEAAAAGDEAGAQAAAQSADRLATAAKVADFAAHPYHFVWDNILSKAATAAGERVTSAYGATNPGAAEAEQGEVPLSAEDQSPTEQAGVAPEGTTRLYRGIAGGTEPHAVPDEGTGAWFADNLENAHLYAGEGGRLERVDVPNDVLEQIPHENTTRFWDEEGNPTGKGYILPDEFVSQAVPHEAAAEATHAPGEGVGAAEATGAQEAAESAQEAPQSAAHKILAGIQRAGSVAHDLAVGPKPPVTPNGVHVTLRDRMLAQLGGRIEARRARDGIIYNEVLADAARRATLNSPAVRDAFDIARQYALPLVNGDKALASQLVGEEIKSRLTGTRQLMASLGVDDREQVRLGIRNNELPEELKTDPEFNARIDAAVEAWRQQRIEALDRLRSTRIGEKGLEGIDSTTPVLTRSEQRELRIAAQRVEKARAMGPQVEREANIAQGRVAGFDDTLGKLGEQIRGTEGDLLDLYGRWDETNTRLPAGFRSSNQQARYAAYQTMLDRGFGTWDPNTMRFITTIADTDKGRFMSGIVPGIPPIPLAEATPEFMDAVMRRYQGLFEQSDHVTVGMWTDDGKVYIEPSEILPDNLPYAIALGKARSQLALYDLAKGEEVDTSTGSPTVYGGLIGERPNAKGTGTVSNHTNFDRYMGQVYKAQEKLAGGGKNGARAAENQLSGDDVSRDMDFVATQAYQWSQATGRPMDDFFRKDVIGDIGASLRDLSAPLGSQEFAQTLLNLPTDPDELVKVVDQIRDAGHDVDQMAQWYFRSHDYIERTFRPMGNVHLLDGTEINAADLMYQLVAVTSIQAGPADNLASALTGLANVRDAHLDDRLQAAGRIVKEFRRAEAEGRNLRQTDLMKIMTSGPEHGGLGAVHQMNDKTAQMLVMDILRGHTITPHDGWDGWTTDYLRREQPEAFGNKARGLSERNLPADAVQRAFDARRAYGDTRPDDELMRVAHDDAVMEFHGSKALAKLRSFHSNLSDPEHSPLVTFDSWMKRGFNTNKSGSGFSVDEWRNFADLIRQTAQRYSTLVGRQVMPHELQAIFWGHIKTEISRQNVGIHWAHAADGLDLLHSGQWSVDNDPVLLAEDADLRQAEDERAGRTPVTTSQGVPRPVTTLRSQSRDLGEIVGPFREDESAASYMKRFKLGAPHEVDRTAPVDEQFGRQVADAYDQLKSNPKDPAVKRAYRALIRETKQQFQWMTKHDGITVEFVDRDQNPYNTAGDMAAVHRAMVDDVRNNHHLYVDKTSPDEAHPLMTPEENDLFRAVHDYFGHSRVGNDFSRNGEEIAAELHAQMFSPEARKAMLTETRGQTSYLNFSAHNEARRAQGLEAEFPEQKAAILPAEFRTTGRNGAGRREETQFFTPSETTEKALESSRAALDTLRRELQEVQDLRDAGKPVEAERRYIGIMNRKAGSIRDEEWGDFDDVSLNPVPRAERALGRLAGEALPEREPVGFDPYREYDDSALDEYFQQFNNRVLGVTRFTPEQRALITLYEGADFTTLVHEQAHVLRRILPADDIHQLERAYGVAHGGTWTRDQEERFANDVTGYLASGRADNRALNAVYGRLQENLNATWQNVRDRYWQNRNGVNIPQGTQDLFDRLFNPTERPLEGIIPGFPKGVNEPTDLGNPRRLANEARADAQLRSGLTPYQAYRQGVDSGRLIEKATQLAAKRRALQLESDEVLRQREKLQQDIIDGALPLAQKQRRLFEQGQRGFERVGQSSDRPALTRVPAAWQPMYEAVSKVLEDAKQSPEIVRLIGDDMDGTFSQLIQRATELGVDPVHVRNFSPAEVERLVYRSMRLGRPNERLGNEAAAGTRKVRRMSAYARDASIESLAAAGIETVWEERTNAVVDMVESRFVKEMPAVAAGAKQQLPPGWVPWGPRRGEILGRDAAGDIVGPTGGTLIIPKAVDTVLRQYSHDYGHWMPQWMKRMQNPWKAFVLTLNPRWYVHRMFGNIILALNDGVRPQDIAKAWAQFKKSPEGIRFSEVPGITAGSVGQDLMGNPTLMTTGLKQSMRDAMQRGGVVEAASTLRDQLLHAHDLIDQFFRAADYNKGIRKGLSPEDSMVHATRALVDYASMSPFERQVVTAIVPFYSWEKSILKTALKLPYDHPALVPFMIAMGQANRQLQQQEFGQVLPDAYSSYMKFNGTPVNLSSLNPLQNAATLTSPEGIASAINPFLSLVLEDAYHSPPPGAKAAPHMDNTGHLVSGVDYAKGLTQLGLGLPALGALGGQTSATGVPFSAAQFLGIPTVDPNAVTKIVQRTQKAQAALAQPGVMMSNPNPQIPNPVAGRAPIDLPSTKGYQAFVQGDVRTPAEQAAYSAQQAQSKAQAAAKSRAASRTRTGAKHTSGATHHATPRRPFRPRPGGGAGGGSSKGSGFHFSISKTSKGAFKVKATKLSASKSHKKKGSTSRSTTKRSI